MGPTTLSVHDPLPRRSFLTACGCVLVGGVFGSSRRLMAEEAPSSAGPADPKLVEDLVTSNRILAQEHINDAYGHVSVRHNKNPNRYLLSRSLGPELVTPADLIEYDLDSNPVNLQGREQYRERFLHGEIYKTRPDVNAIVHNHSAEIIPFSVSSVPLRPIYHMAAFIGEGLPIFEILDAIGVTDLLITDSARGGALAKTLEKRPAVLMRGHGITVVGASLPFAVGRSIYLSSNAKVQTQAIGLGGTVKYLDPGEVRKRTEVPENGSYERAWEVWKHNAMAK
jgi:ribulose-5-phosphate 4-epimerase/fuculose-1-phosphate aldolase